MGAVYFVTLKTKFKNEGEKASAVEELGRYIKKDLSHCLENNFVDFSDFDSIIYFLLAGHQNMFKNEKNEGFGYSKYFSGFNASYGWECVLIDAFKIMSPHLNDRSCCRIDIENDYDMLIVKDGKFTQTH